MQLVSVPDDGVPRTGVTSVGLVANTRLPEPVSSVTALAKFALEGVARNVATLVPRPDRPVLTGRSVQLVSVPEVGVPSAGVTSVGLVANTRLPEPVSSVTAPAKLALEGVARNVATLVPRPDTPVPIGRPVQLVSVPELGVPRTGVTSVGLVANTSRPVPVASVTAPAKLALEGVARNVATAAPRPDTPVLIGSPVQLVSVPEVGVPSAGVTSVAVVIVGPVASTTLVVPVTPLLNAEAEICEPPIYTAPTSIVPSVPVNTSDVFVASGINVILPVLSEKPKKPSLAAVPLCQRNSTPRSLLSSVVGAASPPTVIVGSSTVMVVELTVVVVPLTLRLPVTVKLPPMLPSLVVVIVAAVTPPVPKVTFLLASTTTALLASTVPAVTPSRTLSSPALVLTVAPSTCHAPAMLIVLAALNVLIAVNVLFCARYATPDGVAAATAPST